MLSFQAAYAAPIIMMSQNRAAAIDRAHAENGYNHTDESLRLQREQVLLLGKHDEHLNAISSNLSQAMEDQTTGHADHSQPAGD